MPNITNISKTMRMKRTNIPQDILIQLGFDTEEYKFVSNKHSFEMLVKMNDLLTTEQKYAVMEQQGCCKTGRADKESKEFAKEHADKSLAEKLEILSAEGDVHYLNDDGTLSLAVRCYVGDIDSVVRSCHCLSGDYSAEFKSFVEEQPDKVLLFSQFFCGCCAGHQKHHLQNKLDVKLKLKSINASPIETDEGHKRIFTYEIIN